jgi:hypothetical protein
MLRQTLPSYDWVNQLANKKTVGYYIMRCVSIDLSVRVRVVGGAGERRTGCSRTRHQQLRCSPSRTAAGHTRHYVSVQGRHNHPKVGTQSDIRDERYRTEPDIRIYYIGRKRRSPNIMANIGINFLLISDIPILENPCLSVFIFMQSRYEQKYGHD